MTEDRRNFILFAVIAAVILIGWQWGQASFFPPANPPVTQVVDGRSKPIANPAADPTADSPAATRSRDIVLRDSPRVMIDTPALYGSINLRGARLDDLELKRHRETISATSPPIRLLSPAGAPEAYFIQLGWQGGPPPDALWKASGTLLAPGKPVTLEAAGAAGQRFRIELAVDDDYLFTIKQIAANGSGSRLDLTPYGSMSRAVSKDPDFATIHAGPIGVFGNGANYDINFDNLLGKEPGVFARIFGTTAKAGDNYFQTNRGWVGFSDKYWLTALVPQQSVSTQMGFPAARNGRFVAGFSLPLTHLAPGQALTTTSRVFAGAKEVRLLDRYTDQGLVPQLDYAIDWGWFRLVEKPIFYYLDWLFLMVGNFGVAIVLLTITIRLLMFPIAQRQFASMAKMRVVQPKMKVLQERHKEDKEALQRETMALYKTEGVNPLAGCLPTVLQIPIFYALYKVLMLTIEMRHQPFVAWIKDLSAPDPLTPVNLFGLLPFTPPGYLHLGILAILLGGTMWAQFRLSPTGPDPTTQQVMGIMPWVMMFIFAPLAAGLQLYYVASNLISIGQQRLLYARHPQLKVPAT